MCKHEFWRILKFCYIRENFYEFWNGKSELSLYARLSYNEHAAAWDTLLTTVDRFGLAGPF